mgnify:CR=1 FL=1
MMKDYYEFIDRVKDILSISRELECYERYDLIQLFKEIEELKQQEYDQGYEDGYEEGHDEGYEEGLSDVQGEI